MFDGVQSVDVSLDKIAIVGKCPDAPDLQRWIEDNSVKVTPSGETRVIEELRNSRLLRGSADRLTRTWITEDGISITLRLRVPDRQDLIPVDQWGVSPEDETPYRLEWNPNKATPGVLAWFMESPRATRLDVAVDYEGIELDDFTYRRPNVSAARFWDRGSESTGVNLGRRGSPRYCVVYDKAKELGRTDLTMTRFEMRSQLRPADQLLSEKLFDGVQAFRSEIPKSLSPQQAAYLALLHHCPEHFAQLDKRTRKTYLDLADRTCGQLSPHPAEVYLDRRDELLGMADSAIRGDRVRQAVVYQENGIGK